MSTRLTPLVAIITASLTSWVACQGDPPAPDEVAPDVTLADVEEDMGDVSPPPDMMTSGAEDMAEADLATSDMADEPSAEDMNLEPEEDMAPPPPPLTLAGGIALTGVQAFQTIETRLLEAGAPLDPEVPLIAGRETLFRVLVSPEPGWTPREVEAQVVLTDEATGLSETFSAAMTIVGDSTLDVRGSAYELRVPGEKITTTTSISARLVGIGEQAVEEPAPNAARWPADGTRHALEVTDTTGELHVVIVPMRYDGDGSGRLPDTSPAQLALFEDALRAVYPATRVRLEVREPIVWSGYVDWGDFNRELRALKMSDGAEHAYYYGLIRPDETFEDYCSRRCTTGQSFTVSSAEAASYRVGSGVGFSGERWAWTLVHELGHMHGRGHATCGVSFWDEDRAYPHSGGYVGVWGWDSRRDVIIPPRSATDFMGYCDELWASDYTYLGILERMQEANALARPLSLPAEQTWRYIDWSEDRAPRWGRTSRERDPATGEWALARFYDAEGAVLDELQVPLVRYAHDGERSVLVPELPAGAHRVDIEAPSASFTLTAP